MQLFLSETPASKAIQLFIHLNSISGINIHVAQNSTIHLESKEGKIVGPIAVTRYLNSLSKDKSFISRKDDFEYSAIHQWASFALNHDLSKFLGYLNCSITNGTYFVGNGISIADLFLYTHLEAHISAFDNKEHISLARWFTFIQNVDNTKKPVHLNLSVDKYAFRVIPELVAKKEEKKEEKKKEEPKKEEVKKDAKVATPEVPLICLADIRVGHIISAKKHEKADRLYVEQIDLGEEKPRTICSGLVPHMPVENLLGKKVLVFCNLKPKNSVGIDSFGMVLCATDPETKKVELVHVPEDMKPGTKVVWGKLTSTPEQFVNEKKLKPLLEGLKTDKDGNVVFGEHLATVDWKNCTSNFKNAHVA